MISFTYLPVMTLIVEAFFLSSSVIAMSSGLISIISATVFVSSLESLSSLYLFKDFLRLSYLETVMFSSLATSLSTARHFSLGDFTPLGLSTRLYCSSIGISLIPNTSTVSNLVSVMSSNSGSCSMSPLVFSVSTLLIWLARLAATNLVSSMTSSSSSITEPTISASKSMSISSIFSNSSTSSSLGISDCRVSSGSETLSSVSGLSAVISSESLSSSGYPSLISSLMSSADSPSSITTSAVSPASFICSSSVNSTKEESRLAICRLINRRIKSLPMSKGLTLPLGFSSDCLQLFSVPRLNKVKTLL